MALARVGRHIDPMFQPENLLMLQSGYRADAQPLTQFLGRMPVTIEPRLFFTDAVNSERAS